MTLSLKHLSVTINRPKDVVYDFASRPENMVKWAAGLSNSMMEEGDHWVSLSPMGKVRVYFAEKNKFGIIDHDVVLEDGKRFHNPLRVIENGQGAEVIFTLFRVPGISDAEFERDSAMVMKDLQTLRSLLDP